MKTAFKSASDRNGADAVTLTRSVARTGWAAAGLYAAIAFVVFGLIAVATSRADSVWPSTGARNMYADHKAAATGDIVTIVVAESVAAQNSQSKSSTRDSSLEDAFSKFLYTGLAVHGGELPGMSATGKATYSGGGDVSNTQSLSSRAAVLVTDVLPNGNLVIEGVRVVRFSGETQYVVLHGLVRPDDVARDNTVISSNVADARVEFYSEGALTEAQKRGWLAKIYEKLRPF
jgi:flagellar L-ring protein precursor FlgH